MNELSQFLSNPNLWTQSLLELIPFCLLKDITPLITPSRLSCVTFPDLLPPHSWFSAPFRAYIILWVYNFGFHFFSSHSLLNLLQPAFHPNGPGNSPCQGPLGLPWCFNAMNNSVLISVTSLTGDTLTCSLPEQFTSLGFHPVYHSLNSPTS